MLISPIAKPYHSSKVFIIIPHLAFTLPFPCPLSSSQRIPIAPHFLRLRMPIYNLTINDEEIKTWIISNQLELEPGHRELMLSSVNEGNFVVGLDIEQTNNEIDLLKLASADICLLIQLRRFEKESIPSSLSRFLQLPEISFVGVGIKYSLDALERVHKIRCRNSADLGSIAAAVRDDPGIQGSGLFNLAHFVACIFHDTVKSPDVAFGDWNNDALSKDQIRFATTDAFLAFLVGKNLLR